MKLPTYSSYKSAKTEWIGRIPSHWEEWKVNHGFSQIGSGTTPKSDNSLFYDGDTLWVTTAELRESIIYDTTNKVTQEALEQHSALRVYPVGSVLIAMYGATIGRLGILGHVATVNQACCVFSRPEKFDPRFFYYWMWMRRPILISLSSGGGQPNLNQEELKRLRIPIPSIREQERIAAFLDWKTGQIDALIGKKKELLEKLKEKRIAVITQAVTRGLNPAAPMRDSGIHWLGQVPQHWEVPALKFRYNVELGKMLDEKRITGEHSISYLRNVDVQWDQVNYEDLPVMDITPDEYSRYTIREGDVLVCEGGEVGRSAVVHGPPGVIGFQKAIHRLRAHSEDELPMFVYYTLLWAVNTEVFSVEGSSTIAHLTADKLRQYRLPQPPLCEQKAIVAYLDVKVGAMNRLASMVEVAIDRLTEYRTALITAATTGKIDVRKVKIPKQMV